MIMNFQFRQQPTTLSVQALNVELARVSPSGEVTINWEEVEKVAEAKASNMQTAMAKMLIAARDAGKQAAPAVLQGEPTEDTTYKLAGEIGYEVAPFDFLFRGKELHQFAAALCEKQGGV